MADTDVLESVAKSKKGTDRKQEILSEERVKRFSHTKPENRVFKLENNKKQGKHIIVCQEDVIDPETGRPRRMRLLRGATSIWTDEQQQFEKQKGYVQNPENLLKIEISNGTFIVPKDDILFNQFVDLSNRNIENPFRRGIMKEYFREYDVKKLGEKQLQDENRELEALQVAATAHIDDIIAHALYLNVDFIDPVTGHELDENGIRRVYMRKAKADPNKFLNSIHSPIVQTSYKIRQAIDKQLIDLYREPNAIYWTNGGFIQILPQGRKPVEFLTEFAQMSNEASQQFVYQLKTLLP